MIIILLFIVLTSETIILGCKLVIILLTNTIKNVLSAIQYILILNYYYFFTY